MVGVCHPRDIAISSEIIVLLLIVLTHTMRQSLFGIDFVSDIQIKGTPKPNNLSLNGNYKLTAPVLLINADN